MHLSAPQRIRVTNVCMELFSGNINDVNVRSIYQLLREKAPAGCITKEIGDFFAHPEKDRGFLKKHVTKVANEFFNNKDISTKIPAVLSYEIIIEDINHNLKNYQLEIHGQIAKAFCLVVFNALIGSYIKFDVGNVHLGFKSELNGSINLIGVMKNSGDTQYTAFPIFRFNNVFNFPDYESMDPNDNLNAVLIIEFIKGKISYFQETPSRRVNAVQIPYAPDYQPNHTIRSGIETRTKLHLPTPADFAMHADKQSNNCISENASINTEISSKEGDKK